MSEKTTEYYMAEIHRLTLEARRWETEARVNKTNQYHYKHMQDEYKKLNDEINELWNDPVRQKAARLEEEVKQLREVIREQQFYVAQRKACESCSEHVDYAPNLQDMARHFAGLLEAGERKGLLEELLVKVDAEISEVNLNEHRVDSYTSGWVDGLILARNWVEDALRSGRCQNE